VYNIVPRPGVPFHDRHAMYPETLKSSRDVATFKAVKHAMKMTTGDTRSEVHRVLFSLPEQAPAMVLRAGQLLKDAGHDEAATEIYETFIAGLERHVMAPLEPRAPAKDDLGLLLVRSNPARYTLA
jgi:hypothetical protein